VGVGDGGVAKPGGSIIVIWHALTSR